MKMPSLIVAVAFAISTLISAPVVAAGVQGEADMQGTMQLQKSDSSDFIGKTVVGMHGEELGKVENVIIGKDGEEKYLLFSRAGESDENLVAVPWSMVKTSDDRLALNISKDKIEKAPTFSKETTFNREWESKVNAYYGMETGAQAVPETSGKFEEQGEFQGETRPSGEFEEKGAMRERTEATFEGQAFGFLEGKDLIGKSIVTPQGERVGDLRDILIDQSGRLKYAIISTGGFLGIGREEVAVPWRMVQLSPEKQMIVQVDKEKIMNAPTFSEKSYSLEWEKEVSSYYGVEGEMAPGAAYEHGKMEKSTEKSGEFEHGKLEKSTPGSAYLKSDESAKGTMQGRYEGTGTFGVMTSAELLKKEVVIEQGERVGTVRDFIVGENGRIHYLILSLEGRRGEVLVPWQLVRFSPETDVLSLTITKDKIENAPKFQKSDVQKFSDPEWNHRIYSYYGIEYSEMDMEKGTMHKDMMMEKDKTHEGSMMEKDRTMEKGY